MLGWIVIGAGIAAWCVALLLTLRDRKASRMNRGVTLAVLLAAIPIAAIYWAHR